MISYRKLAMRVLGHSPVSAAKTARRRSTAKRAAALALTAALVVGMTLPAFAQDWFIENGDIKISAGTNGNNVTQGETTKENDTDTVIKGNGSSTASSHTVTIHADEGKTVNVTLENVNIDASSGAAVSVTGKGDTNIELNGNNTLTSRDWHAGLEHNKTNDSGTLTITDNNNDGKLTAKATGDYGAGIGGGSGNNGQVTITGGEITAKGGFNGAGIGGGNYGNGTVTISGGTITEASGGGNMAAGIGGGRFGDSEIIIKDKAVIENAKGSANGAGIGSGYQGLGTVTIEGNAVIKNAQGGASGAAGIGGGTLGIGNVTIKDNAQIGNAIGGEEGAGIGGGRCGLGNVSIEGNVTIENAQGGAGAAGIGGGAESKPDDEGNGNKISIKSTEAGSPDITATGGGARGGNSHVSPLPGAAAIGSGSVNNKLPDQAKAKSAITIEGKVTINATGGGNIAIGDNIDGEKVFNGLAGGTTIKRTDSNGKDVTQNGDVVAEPEPEKPEPEKPEPEPEKPEPEKPKPEPEKPEPEKPKPEEPEQPAEPEKPAQPTMTPTETEAAEAPSTGSVEVERPVTVEGLYVTNVLGKQITHTCTQNGTTLTIRANGIVTSAHLTLGMVRTLKAQGVKTLVFTTLLSRSTTVSVDALLAADPDAPDETAVVWTHTGLRAALTIDGADHSALLK